MRLRYPFAGAFCILCIIAGYAGLGSVDLSGTNDDKVLHFLAFFVLTITFYWAIEAPRRLLLKIVFLFCTIVLGVGSEFLQMVLSSGRRFDSLDIVANLAGSLLALSLCTWYHGRMLERKRKRKLEGYGLKAGEEEGDLELGEGGSSGQEIGITDRIDAGDDETGEAWDEIGGSEGVESDAGKTTTKAVDS
ncbi:hypothetical protein MMC30_008470 [Trapelia coarctata]|nr:hypothetical protein [Trapelia coarctata]